MKVYAAIVIDDGMRLIPFCRTRRPDIVHTVAEAVLEDLAAASNTAKGTSAKLLRQERTRLVAGLQTLGVLAETEDG
jgi:hypothetical protein